MANIVTFEFWQLNGSMRNQQELLIFESSTDTLNFRIACYYLKI